MLERPQSRKPRKPHASGRVVLYGRVSTVEQAEEGASLFGQRTTLEDWATRNGHTDTEWIEDRGVSGRTMVRPGMQLALSMLTSGEAGILVAVSLSRLSRSVIDAASLLELATNSGFRVVALDLGIDTGTSTGRLIANLMSSVGAWEADVLSERTKAGLAARRALGVRLGRPSTIPDGVRADIEAMREAGVTYAAIAVRLNDRGVPTATGKGQWHTRTVFAAVHGWNPIRVETTPGGNGSQYRNDEPMDESAG